MPVCLLYMCMYSHGSLPFVYASSYLYTLRVPGNSSVSFCLLPLWVSFACLIVIVALVVFLFTSPRSVGSCSARVCIEATLSRASRVGLSSPFFGHECVMLVCPAAPRLYLRARRTIPDAPDGGIHTEATRILRIGTCHVTAIVLSRAP